MLAACGGNQTSTQPATTPTSVTDPATPTVGETLVISANTGQSIYNWSGPLNYAENKADGSNNISFDNIKMDSYTLSRVKRPYRAVVFDKKIGFGDLQLFPFGRYIHRYYKKKIIDTELFVMEDYEVFSVF